MLERERNGFLSQEFGDFLESAGRGGLAWFSEAVKLAFFILVPVPLKSQAFFCSTPFPPGSLPCLIRVGQRTLS